MMYWFRLILEGTLWDNVAAFCWIIVALGCGVSVFLKTCRNALECTTLAVLSISATARGFAIWQRDIATPDSVFVSVAAALYVVVRFYEAWKRRTGHRAANYEMGDRRGERRTGEAERRKAVCGD